MDWLDTYMRQWEYGYEQAKEYHREFGSLDVPAGYVNKKGFPLGRWLRNHIEGNSKTGRSSIKVTPERRAKLDALGLQWMTEDPWQKKIAACREYLAEHGDLAVPQQYGTTEGIWLGKWIYECRRAYRRELMGKNLTKSQIREHDQLDVDWPSPDSRA
ncbi:MAG: helicase associated domain-containing protein, partial [Cloacibacillus sp.]|nr:helicase associated domain-containing protein [Cloacibacillus sp.]